jgi:hypothetical protein
MGFCRSSALCNALAERTRWMKPACCVTALLLAEGDFSRRCYTPTSKPHTPEEENGD